ncbi:hypothetical protein [Caulobacter sp. 17J80-11]|uniref:WD40/YVTN/BNR-like repeat-containing protein n=1 Tax=Caulobacter sp. 17J80-11 TaxID=2763502 RepID=UPI0016536AE4|nr:hypothetical protein [Caulobacter sp. 17J80-11]MBC6981688.1 hypothetical protein [Caulobacter sp. 17J80-11]
MTTAPIGAVKRARRSLARLSRRLGLRPPLPGAPTAAPLPLAPQISLVKEYATPVERRGGISRVRLRLSVPTPPADSERVQFAEHAQGRTVVALGAGFALQSDDLGRGWMRHPLPIETEAVGCFTTASGARLVATAAQAAPEGDATRAWVHRFGADWRADGDALAVSAPWHGSASIGEKDGVVMFAEYPDNAAKYGRKPLESLSPVERVVVPARVWRSRDDGRTWENVFTASPETVRHLHTLVPDPAVARRWWLSSGDRSEEVFVWRSDDDGDTWTDVTCPAPEIAVHSSFARRARACQRMTDLVFHDGWMIWGADDWLGNAQRFGTDDRPPVGSRIYRARTEGPFVPEEIGYCGFPVRSVVDVGPAWLFVTEAKSVRLGARPEAHLVFKDETDRVHRLAQIDNYALSGTGFTYSVASRVTTDGVFFTRRATGDAFNSKTCVLRWEIAFD